MFVTSFVPLPEEMGRDPYVFALISEGDDGDTAETVDGTNVVTPTTVELSQFAFLLEFFSCTVHVDVAVFLGVGGQTPCLFGE